MRSDFSHKKIKQKNKRTYITQKNPLKDIYSKYFEIFQKLNNLLVIYFFITKFMNLFALQKIKQKKTNIHTNYKINPLKDIHSKHFYLIKKLNNLS